MRDRQWVQIQRVTENKAPAGDDTLLPHLGVQQMKKLTSLTAFGCCQGQSLPPSLIHLTIANPVRPVDPAVAMHAVDASGRDQNRAFVCTTRQLCR